MTDDRGQKENPVEVGGACSRRQAEDRRQYAVSRKQGKILDA